MQFCRWGGRVGWCALFGLIVLTGCRREQPSTFDSNLAPDTYISLAPAESTLAYYRVRIFWNGVDPDGVIDHYEFAVTDSNKVPGEDTPGFNGYFRTERTDSLFVLTANLPQILGHRFYVRSVDNEDKTDPTPAWAYFVAHNYNFPSVSWERSIGTWTDRVGGTRTITIRSNVRVNPTDTIGVAGAVDFAWNGFDIDDGGFVTGFEFRRSSDTEFTGGSLADTSLAWNYEPLPGDPYFSGTDVLRVRAIDDAGASTNPDSVRSIVVNFSPVCWIVDPNQPDQPTHRPSFIDEDSGNVWDSGTTLRDGSRNIQFQFIGFDDPRDISLNPETNPSGIIGFQFRRLLNGGGAAYQNIIPWVAFPEVNEFDRVESSNLTSGRYTFLVRAKDELSRFGRPDTVVVDINYFPYFTSVVYLDENGEEQPLWLPGGDQVTVTLSPLPDQTYPDLTVRFASLDQHRPQPDTHPLDVNFVVEEELSFVEEYRSQMNGARDGFERVDPGQPGVKTFPVSNADSPPSGVVRKGSNRLELTCKDVSGKTTKLDLFFTVILAD